MYIHILICEYFRFYFILFEHDAIGSINDILLYEKPTLGRAYTECTRYNNSWIMEVEKVTRCVLTLKRIHHQVYATTTNIQRLNRKLKKINQKPQRFLSFRMKRTRFCGFTSVFLEQLSKQIIVLWVKNPSGKIFIVKMTKYSEKFAAERRRYILGCFPSYNVNLGEYFHIECFYGQ